MKRWEGLVGTSAIWCLCFCVFGCAGDAEKPQPLHMAFNNNAPSPMPPAMAAGTPSAAGAPAVDRTNETVSETVRESVLSPRAASATRNAMPVPNGDAIAPAAARSSATTRAVPGVGNGNTITLGAVVVEVNGQPIYANKVLETIAPVLAADAKQLDLRRFRAKAMEEIRQQVRQLIAEEVVFATAQRNLGKDDQRIADFLTSRWRDDQIRRYGGSLQLARQAAAQQGIDFDDAVKDRYRLELRRVYFQKKEVPKIQITADDMRRYYQRHLADKFTERDQAQFRVVKIGIKPSGGREQARVEAQEVRDRAARGEDFAELAASFNDDAYLKRTKGDPTGEGKWVDRGSYAVSTLEDAVWKLNPEQVTELVEANEAFYVAKLERKKPGRVRSFDEDAVQQQIRKTLEAEQFNALRARAEKRLEDDAIVYPDPPLYAPALEMALQKYPEWASAK